MEMIKLHENFPIYLVKNFYVPIFQKKRIVEKVIENKTLYYDSEKGYNFPILKDYNNFFKKLYSKYYKLCKKKFHFNEYLDSKSVCWAYVSDKNDFKEYWHNHIKTSTINGVYYLNIPKKDNVTIDFELNDEIFTHKVNNYDLLIFPDYLNHKPNRCYNDGYRISINMEIICIESSNEFFLI